MPAYLLVDTAIGNAGDLDRPRSDSGSAHPERRTDQTARSTLLRQYGLSAPVDPTRLLT